MTNREAIKVLERMLESYITFPSILRKIPGTEDRLVESKGAINIAIKLLSRFERERSIREIIEKSPSDIKWEYGADFMKEQFEKLPDITTEDKIKILDKLMYLETQKLPTMTEYMEGKRAK
jgi:hypothetical protein